MNIRWICFWDLTGRSSPDLNLSFFLSLFSYDYLTLRDPIIDTFTTSQKMRALPLRGNGGLGTLVPWP